MLLCPERWTAAWPRWGSPRRGKTLLCNSVKSINCFSGERGERGRQGREAVGEKRQRSTKRWGQVEVPAKLVGDEVASTHQSGRVMATGPLSLSHFGYGKPSGHTPAPQTPACSKSCHEFCCVLWSSERCRVYICAVHRWSRTPDAEATGVPSGVGGLGPELVAAVGGASAGHPANCTWFSREREAPSSRLWVNFTCLVPLPFIWVPLSPELTFWFHAVSIWSLNL